MDELKKFIKGNIPLIAALTSLGYLVSYYYQLSLASYYGYPEEYISFDLDTILRTLAFFLLLIIIAIAPLFLLTQFLGKKWTYLVFFCILLTIYLTIFKFVNPFTFFSVHRAISIIIVLAYLTLPLSFLYILQSYLSDISDNRTGFFLIIITAIMVYIVPSFIGQISAYAKKQYFQLDQQKNYILLSSSGDKLIFGSCSKSGVKFMLKDNSSVESLTPVKDKEEIRKIRECFFYRDFK